MHRFYVLNRKKNKRGPRSKHSKCLSLFFGDDGEKKPVNSYLNVYFKCVTENEIRHLSSSSCYYRWIYKRIPRPTKKCWRYQAAFSYLKKNHKTNVHTNFLPARYIEKKGREKWKRETEDKQIRAKKKKSGME